MYSEISNAAAFIANKFYQWGLDTLELLPNLIVAILLILLFVLLARMVRRGVIRLLSRFMQNEAVVKLIAKLAYIFVFAIGILISLEVLHLERTVTSLLAGIGVIGLGLGIAFQDLAANFISGVSMAMKNQVKIGDLIKTGEFYGTVSYVGLRETIIRTISGQDVIIPNKEIYQNPMIHYTAHQKRRIDLAIGVSYGEDLEAVEKITLEAIRGLDFLLKGKEVKLYFTQFASTGRCTFGVLQIGEVKKIHTERLLISSRICVATRLISASSAYFCRGQKKPFSPSPFLRGTMCT